MRADGGAESLKELLETTDARKEDKKKAPPFDAAAEAADALGLDADDIRRAMKIIESNRKARRR